MYVFIATTTTQCEYRTRTDDGEWRLQTTRHQQPCRYTWWYGSSEAYTSKVKSLGFFCIYKLKLREQLRRTHNGKHGILRPPTTSIQNVLIKIKYKDQLDAAWLSLKLWHLIWVKSFRWDLFFFVSILMTCWQMIKIQGGEMWMSKQGKVCTNEESGWGEGYEKKDGWVVLWLSTSDMSLKAVCESILEFVIVGL